MQVFIHNMKEKYQEEKYTKEQIKKASSKIDQIRVNGQVKEIITSDDSSLTDEVQGLAEQMFGNMTKKESLPPLPKTGQKDTFR